MVERQPAVCGAPLSRDAFTGVVERNQHALHVFLRGMIVQGDEHARDLVQDTFHDAWRAAQRLVSPFLTGTPEEEMRRWLFHTAYCKAISLQRRRRRLRWESLTPVADGTPEPSTDGSAFEDQIAEGEALRAAMAELAPADVACLLLRVVQGFSAAEVGMIVHATPEVVNKRLSRAKQRLRAVYLAQNAPRRDGVRP